VWTYKQFLEYLKLAGHDLPLLPLQVLPEAIDFGFMAKLTREMVKATIADNYGRERMRRLQVNATLAAENQPDELRIKIDASDTIGSQTQVAVKTSRSISISDWDGVVSVRHVGIIHTHPCDSPFSPQDCSHLLLDRSEGRVVVMILGTMQMFMAMLISCHTPVLQPHLREQLVAIESSIVRNGTVYNAMERLSYWCQRFSIAMYSFPWRTFLWRKHTTVAHRISA